MFVYLTMLIISCFGGFIASKVKIEKKNYYITFLIAFLPLFLVSGLRYMVGTDYLNTYVRTYENIAQGYQNVRIDFGFYYFIKIINFIFNNNQWLFIITSFIINFFIVKSIFEQSKNKSLSLFIYVCGTLFFFSMNGVRQSVALSLFYYSLKFIEKKDFKSYLICNIVGAMFHSSAIVFFPLYFLLNRKYKTKTKMIVISISLIFATSLSTLLSNLLINTRYSMYITNGAYKPVSVLSISVLINILLFVLYEFNYKNKNNDLKYNIYSNIHFLGIIVSIFLTKIPLVMRFFVNFRYIEFLSIPYLIDNINISKKNKQIFKAVVIVIYFIYFIHGVYIENGNDVLPYKNIFFKD